MRSDTTARIVALARAGQHAQAVLAATAALDTKTHAAPRLGSAARIALLELRAESLLSLAEPARCEADAAAMLALAERADSAALRARALACLSRVQTQTGYPALGLKSAKAALDAALRSRSQPLIGLALLRQAHAELVLADPAAAEHAAAAKKIFAATGDPTDWPTSADEAWACLPERVYFVPAARAPSFREPCVMAA